MGASWVWAHHGSVGSPSPASCQAMTRCTLAADERKVDCLALPELIGTNLLYTSIVGANGFVQLCHATAHRTVVWFVRIAPIGDDNPRDMLVGQLLDDRSLHG